MKKPRELDAYLSMLMGPLAIVDYHKNGGVVVRKNPLTPSSSPKVPDSSRKAGLGDGR